MKNLEQLTENDLDDKQLLRELYVFQNYKQTELAEIFGTYRGNVREKLKKYGIQKGWKDRELMRELYIEKEKSSVEIAELFNTGTTTVQRWLGKHGIKMRPSKRDKNWQK